MEAQDSAQRSELFYVLLMLAGFTFFTVFSGTTALLHLLARQNLLFKTRVERTVITHSSLLIIPCLIMTILHVSSATSIKILTGIAGSSLLIIGSKIVLSFFQPRIAIRSLCRYRQFFSLLFIFSSCYFGLAVLLGYNPPLVGLHNVALMSVSFATMYVTELKSRPLKTKHLIQASLPLILIPLALPFSCEVQYWLTKHLIVRQDLLYAAMILFFALSSVYLYRRKSAKFYFRNPIRSLHFPILLTTLIIFSYWQAEFTFELGKDLLHPGNFLVPAHLFIGHGLLPFIEFWPDLGLQATLPASLYSVVFGIQGLDGLTYHFLPHLIGGIALYFILCRFFSAQWAFLCSVLLPLAISPAWIASSPHFYFPDRVSYALVSLLFVCWLMESFTTRRLIILWLVALVSFAWMPSTGKTVIQCFCALLVLRSLQRPWENLQSIVISFLTVFLPAFALYCLLLFIYGIDPLDSIQSVLAYNIAEKYVLSYPAIVHGGISGVALWYYGICPLLLLGVSGIIFYRQLRGRHISSKQWMLASLALFTLFAGLRALHRHSLIETYTPVFFIILAALLPFLFFCNRYWCISWATIVFSVSALLLPSPSGLTEALHTAPQQWSSTRPNRVIVNDSEQITVLTDFLKKHLGKDQTYLEFIHGHLLYVLSGHTMPPFHKIARVLSSEHAQELYLKQAQDYLAQDKIPLVILKGPFWGSAVDNIPSSMAVFLISEFIYENYSPFAEVNGFTIMKANNSNIALIPQTVRAITSTRFNEGQLFQTSQTEYTVKKDLLAVSSGSSDPQISNLLAHAQHPVILNTDRTYFLKFRLRSNRTGQLQVYFSADNAEYSEKMSAKLQLKASEKMNDYLMPLPKMGSDIKLTGLRLDPPDHAELSLENIDLIEKLSPAVAAKPISKITQHYDMRKLPYVWANFDQNDKWKSGELLFTEETDRLLNPQQENLFPIPAKIDKTRGNYLHFRIQSTQGGTVRLTYGSEFQNSISFDLMASEQAEEYAIRISSQWAWMEEDISQFAVMCNSKAVVHSYSIRSAD